MWALPAEGRRDELPRLVQAFAAGDPGGGSRGAARALWSIRREARHPAGLDDPEGGLDGRVASLRERLPEDLRRAPAGPDLGSLGFRSLYLTEDEWAAEIANRTVHGVLHLGWVAGDDGRHRGQLAILVKPNGSLGRAYMAAIGPFRHLIVYPAMMRRIERFWNRREL